MDSALSISYHGLRKDGSSCAALERPMISTRQFELNKHVLIFQRLQLAVFIIHDDKMTTSSANNTLRKNYSAKVKNYI